MNSFQSSIYDPNIFGLVLQYFDIEEWIRLRENKIIKKYQDSHKWCLSVNEIDVKYYELLKSGYKQIVQININKCYMKTRIEKTKKILNKISSFISDTNIKKVNFKYFDKLEIIRTFLDNPYFYENLIELDISNTGKPYKNIEPEFLEKFKNLKILKAKNSISYISGNLQNIEVLDVEDCYFSLIPGTLTKLRILNLGTVEYIHEIPETLVTLEELYTETTVNLEELPKTLTKLRKLKVILNNYSDTFINLESLECTDNSLITRVKTLPSTYKKLKYLDCSSCMYLEKLPETYEKLEYLNLHSCKYINQISNTYINLIELDISSSGIKKIPKELVNLIYLDCGDTDISEIPNTLIYLEELDCSYTKIKEIPEELDDLEELNCSNTLVNYLPDTLINLISLDISNTKIKEIPDTFTNLMSIDIIKTKIKKIPETFTMLDRIQCAYTSKLREIPNMSSLGYVMCNKNTKKKIPKHLDRVSPHCFYADCMVYST